MDRDEVFVGINEEREYQEEKWGTEFDTKNTMNDWISYMTRYLGKAQVMSDNKITNEFEFRKNIRKVAALAVAALEQKSYAPRHYDT